MRELMTVERNDQQMRDIMYCICMSCIAFLVDKVNIHTCVFTKHRFKNMRKFKNENTGVGKIKNKMFVVMMMVVN